MVKGCRPRREMLRNLCKSSTGLPIGAVSWDVTGGSRIQRLSVGRYVRSSSFSMEAQPCRAQAITIAFPSSHLRR